MNLHFFKPCYIISSLRVVYKYHLKGRYLYEVYKKLKNDNPDTIYLFRSGIFYIALDADALLLSNKINLKLTNLNQSIVKCGFPSASLDKYVTLFKSNNINFKIIENDTVFSAEEYNGNRKANNIINLIKDVNIDSLSVGDAYKFIENLKDLVKDL